MLRLTVKDLRDAMAKLPDDALVVLQSDSEGNSESTLMCADVINVGETYHWRVDGTNVVWTACESTYGIDLEQDKGKKCLVLTPSL